ncbi:nucleotidyltransferase domain-containing protein [Microlunatus speluncae]|uniref:nucleotidyltransferase domain-containing protein n=1 Tax=Microlunatus speluncae TaxID=2594267 RepID=UPI0012664686|nr:nucleotidyltransferase domain-containing protein [Microlunatus speluncae]
MLLQHPFEVITTATEGPVLEVLAGAESWFTIAQVWRLSGVRSRDQVRRVLARLAGTGILDEEKVASSLRYRLNREHLAAPSIVAIASIRQTLIGRLRETLAPAAGLVYAALFGSVVRGDMHRTSDIDVFLVRVDGPHSDEGDDGTWEAWVRGLEATITRWTGNPVNVFVMLESEVRAAGDTAAVASIVREGVGLYGGASWLSTAVGKLRVE